MRRLFIGLLLVSLACVALVTAGAGNAVSGKAQFVVVAKSASDVAAARADVAKAGGKVTSTLSQVSALVVAGPVDFKSRMSTAHVKGVAKDHVVNLIRPSAGGDSLAFSPSASRTKIDIASTPNAATSMLDPSFAYPGLMWSIGRIHGPLVQNPAQSNQVAVAVMDTGLDYTHVDLANKVRGVVDFTLSEDPPLCSTFFSDF